MDKLTKIIKDTAKDDLHSKLLNKIAKINHFHRIRSTDDWQEILADYQEELNLLVRKGATSAHLGGLGSSTLNNEIHSLVAKIELLEEFIDLLTDHTIDQIEE